MAARSCTEPLHPLDGALTRKKERITAGERIRREPMVLRGLSVKGLGGGKPVFERGSTYGATCTSSMSLS
ncbi:hypothetical protein HD597_000040 [Nonomuraea thailandensis]|uniref:Uncharacterized protein n=1 Tax=Nonomuraea thailandensis TaxID=1188745 RepID=A0A9X2JYT8_9ACTN|nr:hypothetical protein [Nonomuraea thailandensis]